jgi:hypothetical protein
MPEQHLLHLTRFAKHQLETLLRRQLALKGQLKFQFFVFVMFLQFQDRRHRLLSCGRSPRRTILTQAARDGKGFNMNGMRIPIAAIVALALPIRVALSSGEPVSREPQVTPQLTPRLHLSERNLDIPDSGNASGRGLQDGWAIDNSCGVMFTPQVAEAMADAGAAWVRINFRLGASPSWTEPAPCGKPALELYDAVVDNARAEGLQVLGLLSNESWPGDQDDWQANRAEWGPGGSGDNAYLADFATKAAGELMIHFAGRVDAWEVWNEPNAYSYYNEWEGYRGSTFIYPSNFAWLLRRVNEARSAAGVSGTPLISGGVFGHDLTAALTPTLAGVETKRGDPQTPGYAAPRGVARPAAPPSADAAVLDSGAEYLRATYDQGIALAGWGDLEAYPLDGLGQHLYVDQGATTSAAKITAYLEAVRAVPLEHPGATPPPTWITEVGWATNNVSYETQAANLRTAYDTFEATGYVAVPFWFQLRDIEGAGLYYGLLTPFDPQYWTRKPAWDAFHRTRVFSPIIVVASGDAQP